MKHKNEDTRTTRNIQKRSQELVRARSAAPVSKHVPAKTKPEFGFDLAGHPFQKCDGR